MRISLSDISPLRAINEEGVSIKVEEGEITHANYYVKSQAEVESLLTDLF